MNIGGLQKTSFIDFPQKISAVLFTKGCNFTCPYCHNPSLLNNENNINITADELISFLFERKHLLQGLVITGGEPTLQNDLYDFCKEVKKIGYSIKLDTNGSNPLMLQNIIDDYLIDYVAMDIKADPKNYPEEIMKSGQESILKSIEILEHSKIEHEFRIPCVFPFITEDSFTEILSSVKKAPLYLQKVQTEQVLKPSFFLDVAYALKESEIKQLQEIAKKEKKVCIIR